MFKKLACLFVAITVLLSGVTVTAFATIVSADANSTGADVSEEETENAVQEYSSEIETVDIEQPELESSMEETVVEFEADGFDSGLVQDVYTSVQIEEYDDLMSYIHGLAEVKSEYSSSENEMLTIDLASDCVIDENGLLTETYDQTVQDIISQSCTAAQAALLLQQEDYEVYDVQSDCLTVEDVYQTKRIIIQDDHFDGACRASRILKYNDEYVLQYDTEELAIADYEELSSDPSLEYVTLDYTIHLDVVDDSVSIQSYSNTLQGIHFSWGVQAMGLDVMQEKLEEGFRTNEIVENNIVVAVLDSGVNTGSTYLEDRLLQGYDVTDGDYNVNNAKVQHGTHVAGIIVDGTSSNVKILPIKIFSDGSTKADMTDYINAIRYISTQDVDVVNMSIGARNSRSYPVAEELLADLQARGTVICIAAGNSSADASEFYPAKIGTGFTISALKQENEGRYAFDDNYSNYGWDVDFCAPGTDIQASYGASMSKMSGTSMAAPHVSAAAAMILSVHPEYDFEDVQAEFWKYTEYMGDPYYYGAGMLKLSEYEFPNEIRVPIYRLYSPVNNEHLYTTDKNERDVLSQYYSWIYEGIGWYAPGSGMAVYRVYSPVLGNHLYTTDLNEVNVLTSRYGWVKDNDGKPLFYSGGAVPIYRVYNEGLNGMHHLTTDANEYSVLPEFGWIQEGEALFAVSKGKTAN